MFGLPVFTSYQEISILYDGKDGGYKIHDGGVQVSKVIQVGDMLHSKNIC